MDYKEQYDKVLETARTEYAFAKITIIAADNASLQSRNEAATIIRVLENIFSFETLLPQISNDIFKKQYLSVTQQLL